jgi:hypothetical protein
MPRLNPTPLTDRLVTPAAEPGRAPVEKRVPITFRLSEAAHEWLRLRAFEARKTKQAIVDELFASCMVGKSHS